MKKIIYIAGGLILVIGGLIYAKKSGSISGSSNAVTVESQVLNEETIIETVSATGKIQPEVEVKITSEVSGEIIQLLVKEGQEVKKGQLLVKINPDIYTSGLDRSVATLSNSKAGLNQAEAQLKEAKSNYDRNKTLFAKGVISKSEWDKVVSAYEVAVAGKQSAYFNVKSANATVTESQDNLRRTNIFAPSDGTISRLDVELGERVLGTQQMAGTELLRVANLSNMEVEVDVNENDIVKVSIGNEANIEVDAYSKKIFKGTVTSISNSSTSTTTADQVTNFKVKVRLEKSSYSDLTDGKPASYSPFRPGMTATVDILTKTKNNILTVPISAIVMKTDTLSTTKDLGLETGETKKADKQYECVFVNQNGKATLRVVKTGIQDDSKIEILKGLKKGDVIITGPFNTLSKDLKIGDAIAETKK